MTGRYTVRSLRDRAWLRPADRVASRFTATWSDTLDLLLTEVERIGGRDVVIQIDVQESDLRRDGKLRANARPLDPAVVVSFESGHGPLMYRCDRYDDGPWGFWMSPWQHNVRAVALTLEALRAVDRYGASSSGEQYAGWAQIAADAAPAPESDPWSTVLDLAGLDTTTSLGLTRHAVINRAQRRAHPDLGGDAESWARLVAALDQVGGPR